MNDLVLNQGQGEQTAGVRRCPNKKCNALVYFVMKDGAVSMTFPGRRIDFDQTNIPDKIISAFNEALTCHADQCYVASAIMVRKTLEELCNDRGALGDNLKARIVSLRNRIVLPQELLDGMDELRFLGNDAAHIESQVFNGVGQEEVEVAIEFTKEVLKAIYQYSALLARLKALKR